MRLLSVDTSSAAGSIVVSVDGQLAGEVNVHSEETHSVRLLPGIETLLRSCGWSVRDVDAFAVVCGPGSFTGVRIGLTTIKGLAESLSRPTIPITAFDAWVEKFPQQQGVLVPVIDARRGEVYASVLCRSGQVLEVLSPGAVEKAPELVASISHAEACFVGDGAAAYKNLISSRPGWRVLSDDPFLGRAVSRIAFSRAEARMFLSAAELQAYYLRKPDAEMKWKQR
ncbi:MAG: tRNA (adenosine(37)-N6)-threonylcarbamoyltransferase complex dimerization subunit type 1 TsaB [Acidobacteria bacterium]|nr:tRNA (adenosine(37)-N6)-threonylcarbamoyltransferase complex dimerization subunit type 1 TsaB [Acidobacteriota bacterium]MCI0717857.1 tRNA (adenosine(37)-N6)-threonylcarbamoyltransferase complex dimerization subunit type 1 TsaB [Acidobacteriota bacterium]